MIYSYVSIYIYIYIYKKQKKKLFFTGDVMIKILKQMETLNKLSSFLVNFHLLELLMYVYIYIYIYIYIMYMYNVYNVYV